MYPRPNLLGQLIRDSHYVVDEVAVAEAIVMRAMARRVLPEVVFRNASAQPQVRSFRCHRDARSFRLARSRA